MPHRLPRMASSLTVVAAVVLAALALVHGPRGDRAGAPQRAPDFPTSDPSHWINSAPLSMKDLRGRVVILEIWTYG